MAGGPSRKRRRAEESVPAPSNATASLGSAAPLSAVAARKAARLAAQDLAAATTALNGKSLGASVDTEARDCDRDDSDSDTEAFATSIIQEIVSEEPGPPGARYFAPVAGPSRSGSAIAHRDALRAAGVEDEADRLEIELSSAPSESSGEGEEVIATAGSRKSRPRGGTVRRRAKQKDRQTWYDHACVSNWRAVFGGDGVNLHKSDGEFWLGLQESETLILQGTARLRVASGAIGVAGATLTPFSPHFDLVAPASHPLPVVSVVTPSAGSSTKVQGCALDPASFAAIVRISDLAKGVQDLDKPWTFGGAKRLFNHPETFDSAVCGSTFSIVDRLTPEVSRAQLPQTWQAALDGVHLATPRLAAVVEGPKRVGKSTFVNLLVHHLLSTFESVAVLDSDPGQPLSGPPSLVSLAILSSPSAGPAFSNQTTPLRSHFLGCLTPKNAPAAYVAALEDLLGTYRDEFESRRDDSTVKRWRRKSDRAAERSSETTEGGKRRDHVPLVVNTMGWTKGLGADLLTRLKALVSPTDVFAFDESEQPTSATTLLEPIGETSLSPKVLPHEARALALLAYFHAVLDGSRSEARWDFGEPLAARRPFCVSWVGENSPFRGVAFIGAASAPGQLGLALNGTVVAVVAISAPTEEPSPAESTLKIVPVPAPSESACLGLALIRSIDPTTKTFHLLTPIPLSVLAKHHRQLVLVKGSEPDLPVVACLDWTADPASLENGTFGVGWDEVPYLGFMGQMGAGGETKRVRRNLMRKSQVPR